MNCMGIYSQDEGKFNMMLIGELATGKKRGGYLIAPMISFYQSMIHIAAYLRLVIYKTGLQRQIQS